MSKNLKDSISDARAGQASYSEAEWSQRLEVFLRVHGEDGRITELKRPAGGISAASVIFSVESNRQDRGTVHRYVARLKPESSFWTVFDHVEQFNIQRSLHEAGIPVPNALWLDVDGKYLGRPGYVMEFATGSSSTPAYFTDGPLSNISTEQRFRMMRNMIRALAEFHAKADPLALGYLANKGRGETLIERELNMWFDLIDYARPELLPLYEPVRRWLVDTAPEVLDPVVVHGDYQVSNVLWAGEEIAAILDFEVVRIGPRESDVAYQCIMDDLSARFYGGLDIELPSLAQRAEWYQEASGVKLSNLDYHFTRAVFQLACGCATLNRDEKQNLAIEPTSSMDYMNRRVLALLPKSLPFEPSLPIRRK